MEWFGYRIQGSRHTISTTMLNTPARFSRVVWRPFFLLVIGLVSVQPCIAYGANLCTEVRILVQQAHSNWPMGTPGAAAPLMLSDAEDCAITQSLSGQKFYHCKWEFPYRTTGAYSTFDTLNRALRECLDDPVPSSREQRVNHPDFYDLRQYKSGPIEVAVSMKDKSSLQKTYVFLRVYRKNLN